ncbi:hypothetical protein ASE01_00365 [Nocardioides sp. Root190]|nr:hypothetical protein ASE01_00365 [Nocardioides sp. Root190]
MARRCWVIALVGLPVWWLLGLATVVPLLLAAVLAWDLWTRRRIMLPAYLGWWLLFLVWVLLGAITLWQQAPGAVDDGGSGRALVFGYRFGWYVACTIVLVWLVNTTPRQLPDQVVRRVIAVVFVVAVTGGLLGILAPDFAFTTLAERVLPGGLRSNGFVATLVSAEASDVQHVLGHPEPRPKAPFPFTNTWGSVISLTLVFFLAMLREATPRQRWLAAPILAAAAVPVVASLNRGLWLALAAGALGVLVLMALHRRAGALIGLIVALLVAGVLLTGTPLGSTIGERLDNPHSNDRRSQLMVATVASMTEGSPVVGFGGTRNVEGTFTSIAGGATPDCPACGVPPLGTQGQLWLVLFTQGWVGAGFFLAFFALGLRRTFRCRTTNETVATFVLAIFLLQLTVYDTLGLPMLVVMVALGLVAREGPPGSYARTPRPRDLVTVAALSGIGLTSGAVITTRHAEDLRSSSVTMVLEPAASHLDARDLPTWGGAPRVDVTTAEPATVDTEAAVLRSAPVVARAGALTHVPVRELDDAISITAPPHTTVLVLTVTLPAVRDADEVARTLAEQYLVQRRDLLTALRDELKGRLAAELARTDRNDPAWAGTRAYLRTAIDRLASRPVAAGEVLRTSPVVDATQGPMIGLASGAGCGILAGLTLVRLRRGRARSR